MLLITPASLYGAFLSFINTTGGAALFGGIVAIAGILIGFFLNIRVEKYRIENENRKAHYNEIKHICLEPLYKTVKSIYSSNFDFGHYARHGIMPELIVARLSYYYDYLRLGEKEIPYEDWSYFYNFYFVKKTEGLDTSLYEDLDKHFPYLKEELVKCEQFMAKKGLTARQDLFETSKFIYKNIRYKNFIKTVIEKNPKIQEETIRKNYFIFAVILLLTSNDTLAKKIVPAVQDYGEVAKCLNIINVYLGGIKPYSSQWDKWKHETKNKTVEELWEINLEAEKLFDETIREIMILRRKSTLRGNCEYLE